MEDMFYDYLLGMDAFISHRHRGVGYVLLKGDEEVYACTDNTYGIDNPHGINQCGLSVLNQCRTNIVNIVLFG